MPRAYSMSWEGAPAFRWKKMFKGIMYRVGCHELPISRDQWTKDGSAAAANSWWTAKRAELDQAQLSAHPQKQRLKVLQGRKDYATRHGLQDEAAIIDAEILRVQELPAEVSSHYHPVVAKIIAESNIAEGRTPSATILDAATDHTEAVWEDRLKSEKNTPLDRTIGANKDHWLKDRQDEARKGIRSHESADALALGLRHFTDHTGNATPLDAINFDLWAKWFTHCSAQVVRHDKGNGGWSADTAHKYFAASKSFVRWLHESERLDVLPRNFGNKAYKFNRPAKPIPLFTGKEITALVSEAQGIHRLLLLLMLNCGYTQSDVADLRRDEVNLKAGRITRRRSKTSRQKSSMIVSYLLWPETLELLREHISNEGGLALVTKSGKPWVWSETTSEGKLRSSDNVASVFANLKRKLKMTSPGKSLKLFRKNSATLLKSEKEYTDLRFLFLGHSERTIADRHYADVPQDRLDAAVKWLRKQYKF